MTCCSWEEREGKCQSSCRVKEKLRITHFKTINLNFKMNTIRATDQKPFKSLVSKGMMTLARSQTFGIYGHFFKVPREQYASRTYKTIYVL